MKTKRAKTRLVLVKCMVVDSDGMPVNGNGDPLRWHEPPWYEWEIRRRTLRWLANPDNRKQWREIPAKPRGMIAGKLRLERIFRRRKVTR